MIYVEPLEGTEPGNMFLHDLYSCGTVLGRVEEGRDYRVIAITKSLNERSECPFIIIHNEATGERVAICFSEEAKGIVASHYRFQQKITEIKEARGEL